MRNIRNSGLATLAAVFFVVPAVAQESESTEKARDYDTGKRSFDLEEIIVTAQRRQERLQDVPISISVLSGDVLDKSTVRDVTEALGRTPGIVINEIEIGGTTQVAARGVAAASAVGIGASPTAYYLDSAPFGFAKEAFAPAPDAYDLDRVEVLRGPQGTLYGANALNGVVRVLSRDANPDAFELKVRGLTSNTKDGGWNYQGDMAVNVPIVDGKLAARAVLGYQDLSGWIDKPNKQDANDGERSVARLKLNAQPTEQFSVGLSAWLSQADFGGASTGLENRTRAVLIDEPMSSDFDVYSLNAVYEFPAFSVTSMTSYLEYENRSILGGLGAARALIQDAQYDAETFAQEVNITSTREGPWRWSMGAMYRDSQDKGVFFFSSIVTPQARRFSSESYAVFGELTRIFLGGQWDFTVGGRYFEDDVGFREFSRFGSFTPDDLVENDVTFHATTPRVVLTWHPSKQLNVYASYSQGFRSGWQQNPGIPLPPVEPDKLTNYELGSKGSFMGGRFAFDAALYYIDWKDVQQNLSVILPFTNICCTFGGINGESASGVGFDLAMTTQPTDGLELGVNLSWNDLTVDAQVFSGSVLLFDKGDRLNNSGEYTVGAFADSVFLLGGSGFEGQFSVSANYSSELPNRTSTATQRFLVNGDPMLIARTSMSVRAPQNWTATLFVDNLTDEDGAPTKIPNPNVPEDRWTRVRPRTVGLQIEYRFE